MAAGFDAIRRPFMVVMLALYILVSFDGWVLGTEPVWNSLRLLQVVQIGAVFLGLVSSRRAVQQLVAAGTLLVLLLVTFVLRFLPGAFGPS